MYQMNKQWAQRKRRDERNEGSKSIYIKACISLERTKVCSEWTLGFLKVSDR